MWDAVGGFLTAGETAEECLVREAHEEIGCSLTAIEIVGTYDSIYGDTGLHTIGVGFLCRLERPGEIELSGEGDAFSWFASTELPPIAFLDVERALSDAFSRLQSSGTAPSQRTT